MVDLAPPIPSTPFIESVLTRLETLSYWQRRLFMATKMPAQYPRFFYKFFAADPSNTNTIRNLRDVIVESRFWLADHQKFNDPFDLKATLVIEGTAQEKERRLKGLAATQMPGTLRRERRTAVARMMAQSDASLTSVINEVYRMRSKEIGVCSFATDSKPHPGSRHDKHRATASAGLGPCSILMWAHYGRNHEGICLQFETISCPRVFAYAQEVQYSDEYPRVNFLKGFQDSLLTPLVRKHKGWAYEKEWRFLHMTGANTYLPFDSRGLRRVIFGCRASTNVYAAIESLLDERQSKGLPPVMRLRAVQHPSEYKLRLWSLAERQ